ncbi:Ig-like domain-containing protein [Balneolaceae bacterium YR4-1]|uniref:Ig-like domain-containing protein n=1 Tax=Halalkalibaculum roseum TaxID=2709311 RepID=A0A6M1T8R1_9BACT|nr:Ig-like domain-containing protein [Halalkalibaculum roseum]NGP76633.1 Ig-like domain-containing protein [Halalkalibaculum roseum]
MTHFFRISILFCIVAIAYSCATPTSPTGGPPDRQGPEVVATEPESGATNFTKRKVTFHFSEFVNRSSLSGEVTVEPDIGIPYSIDWGRKSVSIVFESSLPDLTTLIVTIGTGLSDTNGNKLAAPQKLAFSTGPEIDQGELRGKVLDAQTGEGNEGHKILLYRTPLNLDQKANYIAETDTGGVFQFSYLRQGTYKAFWVDDRNRNKVWDTERERAQPFSRELIELEKAGSDTLSTLYIANSDTTKAILQGIGLFSSRRLRMRFSENVEILDSTSITITDSLGNSFTEAYPLYRQPEEPYVLFAQAGEALLEQESYNVRVKDISDAAGNLTDSTSFDITGSAQEDTTAQRIIRRKRTTGIYPAESIEIIYANPISDNVIRDSLKVVEGNQLIESWPQARSVNNSFLIDPEDRWKDGLDYEFRIWDPISNDHISLSPEIWHSSKLGQLDIRLADTTRSNTYNLLIRSKERGIMTDTTFSKQIIIRELPPLQYQVTLFEDLNNNGKWDHGSVQPYRAPEPYFIRNNIPVKQGFTSDLTVSPDVYPIRPQN